MHTTMCECGNPKTKGARSCGRCEWLDGRGPMQTRIIRELGSRNTLTVNQLAMAFEMDANSVCQSANRMVKAGRLRKGPVDGERDVYYSLVPYQGAQVAS